MLDRKLSIEYEHFDSYEELEGKTDEFDLFLLDYDMPGMDGLEFSKLLYEKYGEKKLALYALALPKKEEWATDMLNRLLYLNRFLQSPESPYPASLIVIVCESATRMKDAYATIKSIKELDQFNLLFTLDEDVIRGNGIDKLYSCKYNAKTKGVTYTTTSLKLFDKKKPATE